MSECMGTDKPLISIVMAVFEPQLDWLREQLESLNAQTYPSLELRVLDDCSPTVCFAEIQGLVTECITAFPYMLERNQTNLGSNGTFEKLTKQARGEYIAYCDQDDVWLPEKLERLADELKRSGAQLVCSDMYIIDEHGDMKAESIAEIRRHHVFHSGEDLAPELIFHNWVTGCTMLLRTETAKAAIPFCPHMVHDHWIALFCADLGEMRCIPLPLLKYRIHRNNQTLQVAGVFDRESYIEVRIERDIKKHMWLFDHFKCCPKTREIIDESLVWARARKTNMRRRGGRRMVWKYRRYDLLTSLFELFGAAIPEWLFMQIVDMKRENRI